MLKLFSAFPEFGYYRGEDGEEFVCFSQKVLGGITRDATIVAQQFQPQLALIGFLQQSVQLGAEFSIGTGPRGLARVSGDGRAGTDQLGAQDFHFLPFPG